jgi:trehalose 6-phosphate synthase
MNLVAKEYVASRVDGDGALILSKFAGAAWQLRDAIQINPCSIDDGAEAFQAALQMRAEERKRRMRKMRESVEQNNVYRWAGKLLSRLASFEFPGQTEQEYREFVSPRARRAAEFGVAV